MLHSAEWRRTKSAARVSKTTVTVFVRATGVVVVGGPHRVIRWNRTRVPRGHIISIYSFRVRRAALVRRLDADLGHATLAAGGCDAKTERIASLL